MFHPGYYWIGDLCYIFNHDAWDQKIMRYFDEKNGIRVPDPKCHMEFTAHGDGVFEDDERKGYAVDAGSIGCISFFSLKKAHEDGLLSEMGNDIVNHVDKVYGLTATKPDVRAAMFLASEMDIFMTEKYWEDAGHVHFVPEPFVPWRNEEGVLHFGDVKIYTD